MNLIISLLLVTAPDGSFFPATAAEPGTGVRRLMALQGGGRGTRSHQSQALGRLFGFPHVRGASKSVFLGLFQAVIMNSGKRAPFRGLHSLLFCCQIYPLYRGVHTV